MRVISVLLIAALSNGVLFAEAVKYPARKVPSWVKPKGVSCRILGKGEGGAMQGVSIHPKKPNIAYVGGDMGSTFARTENYGRTWEMLPPGKDGKVQFCHVRQRAERQQKLVSPSVLR